MHLEGSCQCGAVQFSLESDSPCPYMHCHCSICRKTGGGGGYGINLGGDAHSLRVRGKKHVSRYHAVMRETCFLPRTRSEWASPPRLMP